MMRRVFSVGAGLGLILASAGMVWASSESHSANVYLDGPTTLAGKVLPAGDYRLEWKGDQPKVDVTVERNDRTVAVAQAKLEERAKPAKVESVLTRRTKSGASIVEEVRLRGKKTALVFPQS
jgi:hypothetical protein